MSIEGRKQRRVYLRKYHLLKRRSPRSILKFVTITDQGVTCQILTEAGWKPVAFRYAAGLAADVAVLRAALDKWDLLVAHRDESEAKHGS